MATYFFPKSERSDFLSQKSFQYPPTKTSEIFYRDHSNDSKYTHFNSVEPSSQFLNSTYKDSPRIEPSSFNVQSKITSILKKSDRTQNDAILIYDHLKNSTFFQRFKQENPQLRSTKALIHLSKILEYHAYPPGGIIFRKGDPSNERIYLVFSGKVELYCTPQPKKNVEAPPVGGKLKQKIMKSFFPMGLKGTSKTPKAVGKESSISFQTKVGFSIPNVDTYSESQAVLTRNRATTGYKKSTTLQSNLFLTLKNSEGKVATPREKKLQRADAMALKLMKSDQDIDKKVYITDYFESYHRPLERNTSMDNLDTLSQQKQEFEYTSIILDEESWKDKIRSFERPNNRSFQAKNLYFPEGSNMFRKTSKTLIVDEEEEDDLDFGETVNSLDNLIECEKEQKGKKKVILRGEVFGEDLLLADPQADAERKWTAEVTGDQECIVMSFRKEDYEYLKTRYDHQNTKIIDFLLDHIPNLEEVTKEETLDTIENLFTEEIFNWRQAVTTQGLNTNKIYILLDGLCEVYKEIREPGNQMLDKSKKENMVLTREAGWSKLMKVLICEMKPGVLIGEEILFNKTGEYDYTVKAGSTQVKLLGIEKAKFIHYMPEKVLRGLKKLYLQKIKHNDEIFATKFQLKKSINQQRSFVMDRSGDLGNSGVQRQVSPIPILGNKPLKNLALITQKIQDNHTPRPLSQRDSQAGAQEENQQEMVKGLRKSFNPFFRDSFAKEIEREGGLRSGEQKKRVAVIKRKDLPINDFQKPHVNEKIVQISPRNVMENGKTRVSVGKSENGTALKSFRFDFGRDLKESFVEDHEKEIERDAKLVLKMKKSSMERQKTGLLSRLSLGKSFFVSDTPSKSMNESDMVFSTLALSPKNSLPNSELFAAPVSCRNRSKHSEVSMFTPKNKEGNQHKMFIPKKERALSVKNIDQPLKNEMRDSYPSIGVSGKSVVSSRKGSCLVLRK